MLYIDFVYNSFNFLDLFLSVAWLSFALSLPGGYKRWNRFYETNWTNPIKLAAFFLLP